MSVATGSPAGTGPGHPPWTVRRARQVMIAAHVPVIAIAPVFTISGLPDRPATWPDAVIAVLLGVTMGAIQLQHSLAAAHGERPRFGLLTLLALAVAVYLPMAWFGLNWAGSQALLIASALMVLRGWPAAVACAAPVLGTVAVVVSGDIAGPAPGGVAFDVPSSIVYWGIGLPALGLVLYGSARLVWAVDELRAARTELAIALERLRVSRDLHDLLGQSLSAVSFKGDLAGRLLQSDQRAARAEIEGLLGVARSALHDLRAVTHGERAASLHTETRGAATLLAAAGIDAHVTVNLPGLAAPAERVLAWAVREGVTNMLRHGEARTCSITGWRDGGTARLEIMNDEGRAPAGVGAGLAGLAERARALSGSVSARATSDGGFRLLVEIPEETA